jgi:lysozyme family protein
MTPEFLKLIPRVLTVEGGFTDDAADPGGATNRGVTLALFQRYKPGSTVEDLKALTEDGAREVYWELFWNARDLHLQPIAEWSLELAGELLDTGVNCDPRVAAAFLQVGLNALNFNPKDGRDLFTPVAVDGFAGAVTISAMNVLASWRGNEAAVALARICDSFQGVRYVFLALPPEQRGTVLDHFIGKPVLKKFVEGWALKRLGGV